MDTYFITFAALLPLTMALLPGRIFPKRAQQSSTKHLVFAGTSLHFVLLLIALLSGVRGTGFGDDYPGYHDFYSYLLRYQQWPDRLVGKEIGWHYVNFWAASAEIPSGFSLAQ